MMKANNFVKNEYCADEKENFKKEKTIHNKEKILKEEEEAIFYILGILCNRENIKNSIVIESSRNNFVRILVNKLEKISNRIKLVEKNKANEKYNKKDKKYYRIFCNINEKFWKIFQENWKYIKDYAKKLEIERECDSSLKERFEEYENLRRMFLLGFFDFKGFLNIVHYYDKKEKRKKRKIRLRVSSYSLGLLKLVQKMLEKDGIKSRIYCIANRENKNKLYVIEIQGKNSISLFKDKIGSEDRERIDKLESILKY